MEEGHGKKNRRETREIKEEFERPDPENEKIEMGKCNTSKQHGRPHLD